jgi:hypothetical protein
VLRGSDAMREGVAFCKNLIDRPEKARARKGA